MPTRLFWILLLGLLLALVLFILGQQDSQMFERLSEHDYTSLTVSSIWAAVIGSAVIVMFRKQLSQALQAALLWALIAAILLLGYTYRMELRAVGDRVMAEIVPGWVAQRGNTVEIARSRAGDFTVRAQVNGARVPMVLDSGASAVVLTQEAA